MINDLFKSVYKNVI